MLSDIKKYLQEYDTVLLTDIATHFNVEPQAMEAMLSKWEKKGKVEEVICNEDAACGKCCGCKDTIKKMYRWTG